MVTPMPSTAPELHFDCIDDCCWDRRLAAAGGPTPITVIGAYSALTEGTLQSNDDGTIEFCWERLPHWTQDSLDLAEQLREEWLNGANGPSMDPTKMAQRQVVQMNTRLASAIEAGIELLGLRTPHSVAVWLGLRPDLFAEGWFTKPMVDFLIRQGWSNTAIVADSASWGIDAPMNPSAVSARRKRLRAAAPNVVPPSNGRAEENRRRKTERELVAA